jgi:chitosanase
MFILTLVTTACGHNSAQLDASATDASAVDASTLPTLLTALQKRKAEMLTSIWENGTTVLQYGYCENIRDGRGYTSGRAGFCTGTGDAVLVVRCFDAATSASNGLHKYLPALTALETAFNNSGNNQGQTSTLDTVGGYCADWLSTTTGSQGTAFKSCQDQIVDMLYFQPAVQAAKKWGVVRPLTIAALYDAEINQGDDGVAALIKQANTDVGNNAQIIPAAPLALAAESTWLDKFLLRRLALLKGDATWKDSVDRAAQYQVLRTQGNWDLDQRIVSDAKAKTLYPSAGYIDSGYPRCVIAPDGSVTGDAACRQ